MFGPSNHRNRKMPRGSWAVGQAVVCVAEALERRVLLSGSGQILVTNNSSGTIGEYNLDGTTVNASLVTGLSGPTGIVASGSNVFVANEGSGTIGQYNTSGATVNASLISGLVRPWGLAISGDNLFVANSNGTIGEYTTSGVTVNAALISGLSFPASIAVSGNDLFVANWGAGTIGEYDMSGNTINAALVSGLGNPFGITVSGSDLFVTNQTNGTISEYDMSGNTVNASLVSGLPGPYGVVASGSDLFVAGDGAIGEYSTSGNTLNASLISGLSRPWGITVTGGPATVGNQSLFYYGSSFDGGATSPGSSDYNAIATDKTALAPGGTGTFSNVSSYYDGINGVLVDFANLPQGVSLSAADFQFNVDSLLSPNTWTTAPAPTSVVSWTGPNGDPIADIVWANNAIQNQWLQVTVLADSNTNLAASDMFYFGSMIGATGATLNTNSKGTYLRVGPADVTGTELAVGPARVAITSLYDYAHAGRVSPGDVSFVQGLVGPTGLLLITAAAAPQVQVAQGQATQEQAAKVQAAQVYNMSVTAPAPTTSSPAVAPVAAAVVAGTPVLPTVKPAAVNASLSSIPAISMVITSKHIQSAKAKATPATIAGKPAVVSVLAAARLPMVNPITLAADNSLGFFADGLIAPTRGANPAANWDLVGDANGNDVF